MIKNPGAGNATQAGTNGSLVQGFTDNSGTPGSTTINTPSGRAAFAAAASTLTVTNSSVVANSKVFVTLETLDSTLTQILYVTHTGGSFTVNANATATANPKIGFLVVN